MLFCGFLGLKPHNFAKNGQNFENKNSFNAKSYGA